MSKTILFQGDSITDAFRSYENDDYPGSGYATMVKGELGLKYPNEYKFYNRGVSGNRILDVYARIKCDILNLKPDYMSILIGVNDIWHEISSGNGVPADRFYKVYKMLLEDVIKEFPDIKIMILEPFVLEGIATCNIPEIPDRLETFKKGVRERAKIAKEIAKEFNLPFIKLQEKFDEALKSAPADYWLIDGVHPTSMGHTLIKNEWIKEFNKIK